MSGVSEHRERRRPHERDYLETTIATVRQHAGADNCWPQWANIFADEIERLWAVEAATWVPSPLEGGGVRCIICGSVIDSFLPERLQHAKDMHRRECPRATS